MGYVTFIKVYGDAFNNAKLNVNKVVEYMEEHDVDIPDEESPDRRAFLSGVENVLTGLENSEFSISMEGGQVVDDAVIKTLEVLDQTGIIEYVCQNEDVYAETKLFAGVKI